MVTKQERGIINCVTERFSFGDKTIVETNRNHREDANVFELFVEQRNSILNLCISGFQSLSLYSVCKRFIFGTVLCLYHGSHLDACNLSVNYSVCRLLMLIQFAKPQPNMSDVRIIQHMMCDN